MLTPLSVQGSACNRPRTVGRDGQSVPTRPRSDRPPRSVRPDDSSADETPGDGDADRTDAGCRHRSDDRDRGETEPDDANPAGKPSECDREPDPRGRPPEPDAPGDAPRAPGCDRCESDDRCVPRRDPERPEYDPDERIRTAPEDDRSGLGVEQSRPRERRRDRECGADEEAGSAHAGRTDCRPVADPRDRTVVVARDRDEVSDESDDEHWCHRDGEYQERPDHESAARTGGPCSRGTAAPSLDGGHYLPSGVDQGVGCGLSLHRAGVVALRYLNPRTRTARF